MKKYVDFYILFLLIFIKFPLLSFKYCVNISNTFITYKTFPIENKLKGHLTHLMLKYINEICSDADYSLSTFRIT